MKKIIEVLHWSGYLYFLYIFGYSSIYKVFQQSKMMSNMQLLGFDKVWTILIGAFELVGFLGLLVGFWNHKVKNSAILLLFPFAVGALVMHLSRQEYTSYNSLICCVLSVFLLVTDKNFKIIV